MVSGPVRIQETIRFGEDFELDLQSYKLRRAGRVLKLERIPMEVLLLLLEQRGQIVSREQIVERIWGKDVFLDTDNSINGAIRKIRQVLHDDSEQPRYIQTVTGNGYRFIGSVASEKPEKAAAQEQAAPIETPDISQSGVRSGTSIAVVVTLAAVLLAGAAIGSILWFRSRSAPPVSGKVLLAVLPFQNLTGDSSQEYFSDGLTEEMITQLGNLDPQHLRVIARTSVMHYKNSQSALDQVGRELGVQYVIEGSVRRDSNNVRVTAQLIQIKDQTHVWARQYDRELKDLLGLQGEIAREIADEIQLTLGDHHAVLPRPALSPQNYEAYDLYLKGQYYFNKRTTADLQEAIGYFQQATTKDPNYARAYASLAGAYALMEGYSGQAQTEYMPKARAAALRALQIDENLAEAHTALALIVQNYDWDWQSSEKEFRRAIELDPSYATAHQWYAEHLMWRGRFDEALQESERARQLDPLALIIAADNGAILYFSRQYDRAIDKFQSVLDMDPKLTRGHVIIGAYVEKGMFAEALADTQIQHPDVPASGLSWMGYIYGRSGQRAQAYRAVDNLLRLNQTHPVDPMIMARPYLALGDKDQSTAWLKKAYIQHSPELVSLKVSPTFDPLRTDPRFQDLLRRIGLGN